MQAVLKAQINKTDRNDARGIAQMMGVGLYRPVHVKTLRSQKLRMLLTHRKLMLSKAIAIENDLRGTLRNFGLKVGMVGTVKFEARIKELIENLPDLAVLVEPLLVVRRVLREQISILHPRLLVMCVTSSPPVIRLICSPNSSPLLSRVSLGAVVFLSRPAEALHATRSIVTDARPSTRIVYWFDRNDYDAIRQLFADDLQLPESFDQWAEAVENETREMEARNLVPRKTVIDPESSPHTVRRVSSIKMLKRLERSLSSLIGRIMSVASRPRRASLQRKLMPDWMVAHTGASDVRAHRNHAGHAVARRLAAQGYSRP